MAGHIILPPRSFARTKDLSTIHRLTIWVRECVIACDFYTYNIMFLDRTSSCKGDFVLFRMGTFVSPRHTQTQPGGV